MSSKLNSLPFAPTDSVAIQRLETVTEPSKVEQQQNPSQQGAGSSQLEHPIYQGQDRRIPSFLQRQKLAEHNRSELNLHKQVQAPIQELNEESLMASIDALLEDLQSWKHAPTPMRVQESDIDRQDWHRPKRCQQQRWNERLNATKDQLEWIKSFFDNNAYSAAGYFVAGKCIGLLVMDKTSPYIVNFVTHPGSLEGGGALLEHAVNNYKSDSRWAGAKIELTVMGDESLHAYLRFGFVPDSIGSSMTLEPEAIPEKWHKDDENNWHLKKNMGKKYIS